MRTGNIETSRYGVVETREQGELDMETYKHGVQGTDRKTVKQRVQ